jgi:hypothetical protein
LLKGEKKADFYRLVLALAEDHRPVLVNEWLLIHQIALITVQLQRFALAEAGLFSVLDSNDLFDTPGAVRLADFRPRSRDDYEKPQPPPPPPIIRKPQGKERAATSSELGATLEKKISVFERSQGIASELERRRTRLLRRLTEMQVMRVTQQQKIIDVTPKKE